MLLLPSQALVGVCSMKMDDFDVFSIPRISVNVNQITKSFINVKLE